MHTIRHRACAAWISAPSMIRGRSDTYRHASRGGSSCDHNFIIADLAACLFERIGRSLLVCERPGGRVHVRRPARASLLMIKDRRQLQPSSISPRLQGSRTVLTPCTYPLFFGHVLLCEQSDDVTEAEASALVLPYSRLCRRSNDVNGIPSDCASEIFVLAIGRRSSPGYIYGTAGSRKRTSSCRCRDTGARRAAGCMMRVASGGEAGLVSGICLRLRTSCSLPRRSQYHDLRDHVCDDSKQPRCSSARRQTSMYQTEVAYSA